MRRRVFKASGIAVVLAVMVTTAACKSPLCADAQAYSDNTNRQLAMIESNPNLSQAGTQAQLQKARDEAADAQRYVNNCGGDE